MYNEISKEVKNEIEIISERITMDPKLFLLAVNPEKEGVLHKTGKALKDPGPPSGLIRYLPLEQKTNKASFCKGLGATGSSIKPLR